MDIVTVADAVAVLDYLHKRELICTQCGDKLALYENQFQRRCEDCKSTHTRYNKAKVPSELERRIVSALQRWIASNPPREGGEDAGDSAAGQG